MSKQITSSSKYKTKYNSETWVTAAQYIAELVCESIAKQCSTELTFQFWNTIRWKKTFVYQCYLASALLKKYSASSIISVIKICRNLTSLKSPVFIKLLKSQIKRKIEQEEEPVLETVPTKCYEVPRQSFSNKARLEGLD